MTTAIRTSVWTQLLDYVGRSTFLFDKLTDVSSSANPGDILSLPYQAEPTAVAAPSTRAAPQALSPSEYTLTVDSELFYNINVPRRLSQQHMDGQWLSATSRDAFLYMANLRDDRVVDHGIGISGDSVDRHVNLAANTLIDADITNAEAVMFSNQGTYRQNCFWAAHPMAAGSVKRASAGYVGGSGDVNAGRLGIPQIATLNGLPLFETQAVPGGLTEAQRYSVATTGVVIATNVATITVAANHGFVAGMQVYTTGLTANISAASPATVTSVTATTIVVPLTAGDGAMADGVGLVYLASSLLALIDASKFFRASMEDINVDMVKDFEGPDTALQLYSCFGRRAIPGALQFVHCPMTTTA